MDCALRKFVMFVEEQGVIATGCARVCQFLIVDWPVRRLVEQEVVLAACPTARRSLSGHCVRQRPWRWPPQRGSCDREKSLLATSLRTQIERPLRIAGHQLRGDQTQIQNTLRTKPCGPHASPAVRKRSCHNMVSNNLNRGALRVRKPHFHAHSSHSRSGTES